MKLETHSQNNNFYRAIKLFKSFIGTSDPGTGGLKNWYLNDVIYSDNHDRNALITVFNIMCGIVEPECAYAALGYGDSLRDDKPGPETSK